MMIAMDRNMTHPHLYLNHYMPWYTHGFPHETHRRDLTAHGATLKSAKVQRYPTLLFLSICTTETGGPHPDGFI